MIVKKNFIYNLVYQILIIILLLITRLYIARVIGLEGIGIQSYTFSIVNYFVLFTMLGINNHGNRSITIIRNNKEKLNKTFTSIYLVQVMMTSIMDRFIKSMKEYKEFKQLKLKFYLLGDARKELYDLYENMDFAVSSLALFRAYSGRK